jgi:putative transposase
MSFGVVMYNPDIHNRKSIRLAGHDYKKGSYFVTMAVHGRIPLFGKIIDDKMIVSDAGIMLKDVWLDI